jgi:hypothetical protein
MPKTNKQTKKTANFVFIISSAPKNEVYSILISKVRGQGSQMGLGHLMNY